MTNQSFNNEADLLTEEELELLTNYVGGCMSPEEEEAFDDRMAQDDAFFDKIAPMVKIWYSPPPSVIAAGEQAKVEYSERKARASARRLAGWNWRRHVAIAVGSLSAAASVIFAVFQLLLPVVPELGIVANGSGVHRPPSATEKPPVVVAANSSKNPHGTTRQVVIAPVPRDLVVSTPILSPLPSVRLTPSATVVAQNVEIVLRRADSDPGRFMRERDRRFVIAQGGQTAPGVQAAPGKGFHFPRFGLGKIVNWILRRK
jgi:anti-sigma factor RsiW